jgi:3-oxoacyl-[acyl-carrier-protein] synthase-3
MNTFAGIIALDAYLPEQKRTNDWWSSADVDRWRQKRAEAQFRGTAEARDLDTLGARRVREEMSKWHADPFMGCVERRVMPDDMRSIDMEERAARAALEKAALKPEDIDLLLIHSAVPEFVHVPNGGLLAGRLGLRPDVHTIATDAMCNSFLTHVSLARLFIESGRAKNALLVQSAAMSRLMSFADQSSVVFGDGATAEVMAPVRAGFGVLSESHRTDPRSAEGAVCGVPGKKWYEDGRVVLYVHNVERSRLMFLHAWDASSDVFADCFRSAGLAPADVGFFAAHQPMRWFRPVTQEAAGLLAAASMDTFPYLGNVSGCNLPLVLLAGEKEGLLRPGQVVAAFSGAAGSTFSGMLMRWGR